MLSKNTIGLIDFLILTIRLGLSFTQDKEIHEFDVQNVIKAVIQRIAPLFIWRIRLRFAVIPAEGKNTVYLLDHALDAWVYRPHALHILITS